MSSTPAPGPDSGAARVSPESEKVRPGGGGNKKKRFSLTVQHVDEHGGGVRVARLARVVARVGQPRLGDQQPAGGARLGLLRLQADAAAAARRVEVHHFGALQPHHRAGRRRVHVHGARQADGAALFHVHLGGPVDVGLGSCNGYGEGRAGTGERRREKKIEKLKRIRKKK